LEAKFRRQTRLDGNPRRGYPSPMVLLQLDDGAVFDIGTDPQVFDDLTKRKGMLWLMYGASLLRASHVLKKQDAEDALRRGPGSPVAVTFQAIMLAAMAVENALKAVLSEMGKITVRRTNKSAAKLEFPCGGHNLKDLATHAGVAVAPGDKHEEDALEHGEIFIATVGRYPLAIEAEKQVTGGGMRPPQLVDAYTRIFHRSGEAMARAQFPHLPEPPKTVEEAVEHWRNLIQGWIAIP
jgi:hypothetical protein